MNTIEANLDAAASLDNEDALAPFRAEFSFPMDAAGAEKIYLCGNSLGLQPKGAVTAIEQELEDWRNLGVDGHFSARHPWMPAHEFVTANLAELTGSKPAEVVAMNSLTVNLHLMMVSFYRPTAARPRIVIEKQAFPSDRYAVESQIRFHGFDPADALVELEDEPGSATLSLDTLAEYLKREGERVALILMPGVQYLSGQLQDMRGVCSLAHQHGIAVGLDLAHAVGNVPLELHDWGADFAVWCSYKYLNSGPGAVAGCFVHERHHRNPALPRFAGWWGHDKTTRFEMGPEFRPTPSAEGWQLSNPPIMALAPLRASLDVFHRATMPALREKSIRLTAWLSELLEQHVPDAIAVRTPQDPAQRGCQLSLRLRRGAGEGKKLHQRLEADGVICDWREPDVIRIAPAPLYNSFTDVARFVERLQNALS